MNIFSREPSGHNKANQPKYVVDSIIKVDKYSSGSSGYWMFLPDFKIETKTNVVVFIHGYGAYNPMIYGGWIKHLVRQGKIVIFPRYQRNIFYPSAKKFPKTASKGIKSALDRLSSDYPIYDISSQSISYAGHSYGGVIISNLAVNYKEYGLPPADIALLCSPGSGILKGAVLKSYSSLPENVKLVVITSEDDMIVRTRFANLLVKTAINTRNKWWFHQYSDYNSDGEYISAHHNECYSIDPEFDSGQRNITTKRALSIGRTNLLDYNMYWRIFDDLFAFKVQPPVDISFYTNKWKNIGKWSNGDKIKELEVRMTPFGLAF